jgi:hypothetical protein
MSRPTSTPPAFRLARCSLATLAATAIPLALLFPSTSSAARLSEKHICKVRSCRTLVANDDIRIFRASARRSVREGEYRSTFAEWLPRHRLRLLADEEGLGASEVEGTPALAGEFAAYALLVGEGRYPGESRSMILVRLNVKTGDVTVASANGSHGAEIGHTSRGVTDVCVTTAGSIAWMIEGEFADPLEPVPSHSFTPSGARAIYAAPAEGTSPLLLAFSATIAARSLACIADHIYWLEGSSPRTYAAP